MPGRSCSPPVHVHPQDEYLETLSGAFAYNVDGTDTPVQYPGDPPIVVPAGVQHYFWNAQPDQPGVLLASFKPTGDVQLNFGDAVELRVVATI